MVPTKNHLGFTLIELLVGIGVSFLVLMAAWQFFELCNKGFHSKQKYAEILGDQFVLERKLRRMENESIHCECRLGKIVFIDSSSLEHSVLDSTKVWLSEVDSLEAICSPLDPNMAVLRFTRRGFVSRIAFNQCQVKME